MRSLEDLEKKINSELTTKINNTELKHNQIDAVLLDINLPDGDGTRLARLIRKNHMPVPMLVVSGNIGIDDKITALGAGADGSLTKPFDRYELVANLEAIIRRTHGHSSATVNVGNLYSEPYLMQKPCAYLRDTLRIGPELFK